MTGIPDTVARAPTNCVVVLTSRGHRAQASWGRWKSRRQKKPPESGGDVGFSGHSHSLVLSPPRTRCLGLVTCALLPYLKQPLCQVLATSPKEPKPLCRCSLGTTCLTRGMRGARSVTESVRSVSQCQRSVRAGADTPGACHLPGSPSSRRSIRRSIVRRTSLKMDLLEFAFAEVSSCPTVGRPSGSCRFEAKLP